MAKKKGFDLERLVRIPNVWGYDVAPDGKTAAIVWDKSGRLEIYLLSLTGAGRPRRITSGPGGKVAPRFAPEGKRLVFAQDYGGDENYDLFVYDIKTRATRNLTPDTPAETINPRAAWSPDGRWLAFTSNRGGQFATYIMPADSGLGGGPPRRITQHEYSDMTVEWSPSGEHLAITALTQGQETWIFLAPVADGAAGGAAWVVGGPGGPVDATQPRWAPDGRRLACSGNAGGMTVIYIYSLSPAGLVQVTPGTHEAAEPAWAPDGERLAVTLSRDGGSQLFSIGKGGESPRRLASSPAIDTEAQYSVDGRYLYFTSDRGGAPQIYRMAANGGNAERVTFSGGYSISPSVSPDGRTLAYVTRNGNAFKLVVLDLATPGAQPVTITETGDDEHPSFAPNGRLLIYATKLQGRSVLMTTTLDGKIKARLPSQTADLREPVWGPYGR